MRKRLLGLLVVSVVAVLAFGGATASAHTWRANTNIDITQASGDTSFVRVEGNLISPRDRCERGRFVSLFAVNDDTNPDTVTFIDGDVSSFSGQFVLQGNYPTNADFFFVHVTRQNVGPEGHQHICRGDTTDPFNF